MAEQESRDPESFLGLEAEASKGKLKIYLGGAAGVGKTYRMLEEAHQLRAQGHDVVLGLIEPHQRAETTALIGDLEGLRCARSPIAAPSSRRWTSTRFWRASRST